MFSSPNQFLSRQFAQFGPMADLTFPTYSVAFSEAA
jgi:hypothetical protein